MQLCRKEYTIALIDGTPDKDCWQHVYMFLEVRYNQGLSKMYASHGWGPKTGIMPIACDLASCIIT
jgi:hypothetical protein